MLHQLFIAVFVDEQNDRMCGSAQDRLLRLMKELETELEVELLNRMNLAYLKGNTAKVVKMNDFAKLLNDGEIDENTIVFDNTITTKLAFDKNWKLPLKESWHKQLI